MKGIQENHFSAGESCQLPVTVVIVNYNAGLLLERCIKAVIRHVAQLIVVDNASSDSSLRELEITAPRERNLRVIRLNSNIGFAAACNKGIKLAEQPYVLFLNPDCILSGESLRCMVKVIQSDPRNGMVGGFLANPDGSEQGGGRRAIPTPWRAFVRAFGLYRLEKLWPQLFMDFHLHNQPLPTEPIAVEAISGALMLVRREAIDNVGLWDEEYFLHCEDLDWCVRFKQSGWNIVFVPNAPVVHFKGACSHARPFFVNWHKHRGMLRFYRKFFRQQYSAMTMGLITLAVWFRFGTIVLVHLLQSGYRLLNTKHE